MDPIVTNTGGEIIFNSVNIQNTLGAEKSWICRYHPIDWFHEVGCPHMRWTPEQLKEAERIREEGKKYSGQIFTPEIMDKINAPNC